MTKLPFIGVELDDDDMKKLPFSITEITEQMIEDSRLVKFSDDEADADEAIAACREAWILGKKIWGVKYPEGIIGISPSRQMVNMMTNCLNGAFTKGYVTGHKSASKGHRHIDPTTMHRVPEDILENAVKPFIDTYMKLRLAVVDMIKAWDHETERTPDAIKHLKELLDDTPEGFVIIGPNPDS